MKRNFLKNKQLRDFMTKYAHDLCFIFAAVMSGSFGTNKTGL